MKHFMDENFLLETETARMLYHDYAKDMPIFDYHCHLSAQDIAENRSFRNMTEVWLEDDHYKWRLLRSNGVAEEYITGDKSDKEKFDKWAETVPSTIGNPLYQWTHLELRRFFGVEELLSTKTADHIWETCNRMLQQPSFTAQELIKRSNVKALCTTDDPVDGLAYHKQLKDDTQFNVKVLPTFRPDAALNIDHQGFAQWIDKLEKTTGVKVESYQSLVDALRLRVVYFHEVGCRLSDHGMELSFYQEWTEEEIDQIVNKRLAGEHLDDHEIEKYKTAVFIALGRMYAEYGWAMQLHIGAIRSTNTRMLKAIGPNTGFDSIADEPFAADLARLLDALDVTQSLPKTILYCLNPRDNYVVASMIGNFQEGIPGKIQFGTAWWFNDQRDGIEEQLKALANVGLLARFVGMLTDSRSILSYTRHEYFRRILCNMIGKWVENGEYPADFDLLGGIVQDICYNNIERYLAIQAR